VERCQRVPENLEEPPGSATLISRRLSVFPASDHRFALPAIHSRRCRPPRFEAILKEKSDLAPAAVNSLPSFLKAARAGTGNGRRKETKRRGALAILERSARVRVRTNFCADFGHRKDREISFDEQRPFL